jgi:hypothetical protein
VGIHGILDDDAFVVVSAGIDRKTAPVYPDGGVGPKFVRAVIKCGFIEDVVSFPVVNGHVKNVIDFEVGKEMRAVGKFRHETHLWNAYLDDAATVCEFVVLYGNPELRVAGTDTARGGKNEVFPLELGVD